MKEPFILWIEQILWSSSGEQNNGVKTCDYCNKNWTHFQRTVLTHRHGWCNLTIDEVTTSESELEVPTVLNEVSLQVSKHTNINNRNLFLERLGCEYNGPIIELLGLMLNACNTCYATHRLWIHQEVQSSLFKFGFIIDFCCKPFVCAL